MKKILIIKNIRREGPGLLEHVLLERNLPYDILCHESGEMFFKPDEYKALVVLGGPDSANDETDKIKTELQAIEAWLHEGRPYFGICLGMQLMVKAAGGNVLKSPIKEVGFRDAHGLPFQVELTEAGSSSPLLEGLGRKFSVFQLHGETVELTDSMTLLGSGGEVANQIVQTGDNAFGMQCHLEVTKELLEDWAENDDDLRVLDRRELLRDFENARPEMMISCRRMFENFLQLAGIIPPFYGEVLYDR